MLSYLEAADYSSEKKKIVSLEALSLGPPALRIWAEAAFTGVCCGLEESAVLCSRFLSAFSVEAVCARVTLGGP